LAIVTAICLVVLLIGIRFFKKRIPKLAEYF